jgi:hypothetical protein
MIEDYKIKVPVSLAPNDLKSGRKNTSSQRGSGVRLVQNTILLIFA